MLSIYNVAILTRFWSRCLCWKTKYDCRPCMKYVEKHVTEYFPRKEEEDDKKD